MSQFDEVRKRVRHAITPIKEIDIQTCADPDFLFTATETVAGKELPAYYFVYFLFVEFLGFRNLGRFEKIAWSVPIDYLGTAYLIEHRKFGLGLFAKDKEDANSSQIVELIKRGVNIAQPFFKWKAEQAVQNAKFNVINRALSLYERYNYLRSLYDSTQVELTSDKLEYEFEQSQRKLSHEHGWNSTKLGREAPYSKILPLLRHRWVTRSERLGWLAIGVIDAFFSWTEHVFIHLAIIQSKVKTGDEVAQLVGADWGDKFKKALDLNDKNSKNFYDKLISVRRQIRNFMAHGAFGKQGEAFRFHSAIGAVPVAFTEKRSSSKFEILNGFAFNDEEALTLIEQFIEYLWTGGREPAYIYIQESDLPLILSMANDNTYSTAMRSIVDMEELIVTMHDQIDRAANMDW